MPAWKPDNATLPEELKAARPLLERLHSMGYFERVQALVGTPLAGRHILDVGCGSGFYAPVFLALGAASYTGCDYKFDPTSRRARDFTNLKMTSIDLTAADLMRMFPERIDLRTGGFESLPTTRNYDLVLMYMVTEHILDLDGAFSAVREWLEPDGRFQFLHHNYAAWNGHHQIPRTIEEIDSDDEVQARYLDWNHLIAPPHMSDPHHYTARKLNRIRVHDLKNMTEQYFHIEAWEELPSTHSQGRDRLDNVIRNKLPEYSDHELLCQAVRCTASKKL